VLSIKAGLRAAEMASLTWEMVLTPGRETGTDALRCRDVWLDWLRDSDCSDRRRFTFFSRNSIPGEPDYWVEILRRR
jgi:hypothetical protein